MVKILDAFEIPASIVMEYINGPTLTEAKTWGYLDSLNECLETLIQIGMVVYKAHNLYERVLHRDLKPDNVILRDFYNKNDAIDVVVLDFDLSWHKGAAELSVVHGARAQGYAAPEQTASGRKINVSTRNTAVDVFGYGMLAFFIFQGKNPRPNEQNFIDFKSNIINHIDNTYSYSWKCIPSYLYKIIENCTWDEQSRRIPLYSAIESLKACKEMVTENKISSDNPIILSEIAIRLDPDGEYEEEDYGRHLTVKSLDETKRVDLYLKDDGKNMEVFINFNIIRSEADHRYVTKYIKKAKDKALSKLKSSPLTRSGYKIRTSALDLYTYWPLKKYVGIDELTVVVDKLAEARYEPKLSDFPFVSTFYQC